jgi:ABC-type glycerol-3-phosphate transport system substrate-binding protein
MTIDRRQFLAGTAGIGALVLAGCGSSTTGGGSGGGGQPTAAPTTSGAAYGRFKGQKLVLSRWSGDPWTSEQRTAADEWGRDTGGSISFSAVPYENLKDKQSLTLTGAGGYDIVYVHPTWFGDFAKAGLLAPIDKYLNDPSRNPPGFGAGSYLPAPLAQGKYQGKLYGLPDFISAVVLAYRTDLLQQAGIAPPATMQDILAAAEKLNGKGGMAGLALPAKRTGSITDIVSTILTAQGNWWYDTTPKATLDAGAARTAVEFYIAAAKYAQKGLLNAAVDDAATTGAQGKAAMVISTTPSLQALEDPSKSSTVGKWGYAPLAVTANKPAGELIYWTWCIAARSKHQDAAYSFLQWYTDTAQQAPIAAQGGTAGATKSFYTDRALTAKLPYLPALNQALTNSNPQPSLPSWPKAQDSIETAVQNAISGKQDAASTVRSMQAAVQTAVGN